MKPVKWIWLAHRRDVPTRLTNLVGQIAIEWSDLEWQLEETIRQLLDASIREGRITTSGMNMKARIYVARNLVQGLVIEKKLPASFVTDLDKIGTRITRKLEGQRNKLIHGLWGRLNGKWYVLRTSGTRTVKELRPELEKVARATFPQREEMNETKMNSILGLIRRARENVELYCGKVENALPPSQHKSPRHIPQSHPSIRVRKQKAP